MPQNIKEGILKTICYADVFDYTLTLDEIWKWLIKIKIAQRAPDSKVKITIQNSKLVGKRDGYYFLKGRNEIVSLRKERKKYSQQKLKVANKVINIIKIIPSVKLIGITGALALDNAKKGDDIDLLIISSKGLLWTTRLLVTSLIEITGIRRHPADSDVNNKICLNMFIDENHLEIPKKEQDLFSAHEVSQMKPLFDRDKIYQEFLIANKWVEKYLPNTIRIAVKTRSARWQAESHDSSEVEELVKRFSNFLERFLKSLQLWYMRNRRTSEVISEGIIRFHPRDAREWVMREYRRRISNSLIQSRRISIQESS